MSHFTIAAAQIPSVRGNVAANAAAHADAIAAAAAHGVSVLVFPELSLIGYEPDLGASLVLRADDARLTSLRDLVIHHQITAIVGAPVANGRGKPAIGAFVLTPGGEMRMYRKMHLGGHEPEYFSPGDTPLSHDVNGHRIGVSICADSSQPSHARAYSDLGAGIYAAGVFLTAEWYETDAPRLQRFATEFALLTVMANQGASTGTYASVGRSAVWAPGGGLLVQADGVNSALVMATHANNGWQGTVVRM
jgi:predicted amidohydrolase